MLKEALDKLPKNIEKKDRLEIPKSQVNVQGNQTIISNFDEIVNTIRRENTHLAKFLFRGLAKPGHISSGRLILQGKVTSELIDSKIKEYMEEFVICKVCKRPDSHLKKDGRITLLFCEACGAKQAVKHT